MATGTGNVKNETRDERYIAILQPALALAHCVQRGAFNRKGGVMRMQALSEQIYAVAEANAMQKEKEGLDRLLADIHGRKVQRA